MVSRFLGWIGSFFTNLAQAVLSAISNTLGYLVQGLINVLTTLFKPILMLLAIIFYFFYKLAELVLALLAVLLAIGKLLYAFVMGLFRTLAGFTWTPTTPDHGSWTSAIGEVFTALEPYQLSKIAYLMLFAIWIMTAIGVIKILSSRGSVD